MVSRILLCPNNFPPQLVKDSSATPIMQDDTRGFSVHFLLLFDALVAPILRARSPAFTESNVHFAKRAQLNAEINSSNEPRLYPVFFRVPNSFATTAAE